MILFSQQDHAQAAIDKPHIHQLFQGLRFEAGIWVRLNPDSAYVQALSPGLAGEFPDNPVDTQPDDWLVIDAYAFPGVAAPGLLPLAAAAEMADRSHYDRWDENLGQAFIIYVPPVEQP
jgi:hypothetical protein